MTVTNRDNDAWGTIRGFVYQVDLSIREWLNLTDSQHLKLEYTEDIDVIDSIKNANGSLNELKESIQVKYRDKELSNGYRKDAEIKLYTNSFLEAILNFWEIKKTFQGELRLRYSTNAKPVLEEKYKNKELYKSGIEIWNAIFENQVIKDEKDTLSLIRIYLTEKTNNRKIITRSCWKEFCLKINDYSDSDLKLFFKQVKIAYSIANFNDISNEIIEEIKNNFTYDDSAAKIIYQHLFEKVFKIISTKDDTKKTHELLFTKQGLVNETQFAISNITNSQTSIISDNLRSLLQLYLDDIKKEFDSVHSKLDDNQIENKELHNITQDRLSNIKTGIEGINSFVNKPKTLEFFESIENIRKGNKVPFITNNELFFFTKNEITSIEIICNWLKKGNSVLLLGIPASGKSFLSFEVATKLELENYIVLYYKLNATNANLLKDISEYKDLKTLFILDDCHNNIEKASELYAKCNNVNTNHCYLYISRIISEAQQQTKDYLISFTSIFYELKKHTITLEDKEIKIKIHGIANKYKDYYKRTINPEYTISSFEKIDEIVGYNVLFLIKCLEIWKESPNRDLANIDLNQFYIIIYNHYFRALDDSSLKIFLSYISLYKYEIPFEYIPNSENISRELEQQGIIVKLKNEYVFDHSETSEILIKAFSLENTLFKRKYKGNVSKFIADNILFYIFSFVDSEYDYPDNIHNIIANVLNSDIKVLEYLFKNERFSNVLIDFYNNYQDEVSLQIIIKKISQSAPLLFLIYFDIIISSPNVKAKLFGVNASFKIFTQILLYLSFQRNIINSFLNKYRYLGFEIIKNSNFNQISHSLIILHRSVSKDYSKDLLSSLHQEGIITDLNNRNFIDFCSALSNISQIDIPLSIKLYKTISKDGIIKKIETENITLASLGKGLAELRKIEPEKTISIYQNIQTKLLISKTKDLKFLSLTKALTSFKKIDKKQTQSFVESLQFDIIISNSNLHSKQGVLDFYAGLNDLSSISRKISNKILNSYSNKVFLNEIDKFNFSEIAKILNSINSVSNSLAKSTLVQIDKQILILNVQKNISRKLAVSLNLINRISPEFATEIMDNLDDNIIKSNILKLSIEKVTDFLINLYQAMPQKALFYSEEIPNQKVLDYIKKSPLLNISTILHRLNFINQEKTHFIYEHLSIDLFIEKANSNKVRFADLIKFISEVLTINPEKTRMIFENIINLPKFNLDEVVEEIEKSKYLEFLVYFPLMPRINLIFSNKIINALSVEFLYQWNKLSHFNNLNSLILILKDLNNKDNLKIISDKLLSEFPHFIDKYSLSNTVNFFKMNLNLLDTRSILLKYGPFLKKKYQYSKPTEKVLYDELIMQIDCSA